MVPVIVQKEVVLSRRSFCSLLSASGLGSALDWRGAQLALRRPNLIILLADDLGYGDLGCYGNRRMRTPNLDRMAAEGARLTEFYAAPTCTPARSSLLTGRYPLRSGLVRVLMPHERFGLPDSEVTLAERLKDQGYSTACIGKWHLGDLPPFRPNRHGFDYSFGLLYSHDMRLPVFQWPPLRLYSNGRALDLPLRFRELTQLYTREALHFIKRSRDNPFFLYLPYSLPHTPLSASVNFRGKSTAGRYGDAVEEIDWSVGEILDALAADGLDNDTLVIFASDNGPDLSAGGSAGILRGGKGTTWEGGIRVPAIFRWPGVIPPGVVRDGISSLMDLYTTLIELAGGDVPSDRQVDGRNILPWLAGGTGSPNLGFFYYSGRHLFAFRSGPWKIHFRKFELGPGGARGPVVSCRPPELYNLFLDPAESVNVAAQYPKMAARLAEETFDSGAVIEPGPLPPPRWRSLLRILRARPV